MLVDEVKQIILNKFDECYEIAKSKGKEVPEILVDWSLKGCCAGQFRSDYGRNYFRVNLQLAVENLDEYIRRTVPHEFAHYIQRIEDKRYCSRSKPHGWTWKNIMLTYFNLTPERCHIYNTENVRQKRSRVRRDYIYVCGCQEHHLTSIRHKKILQGVSYICKRCKQTLKRKETIDNQSGMTYIIIMKDEITVKEINGHKVIKTRVRTPAPKVMKDKTKYTRKTKHKGDEDV